MRSTDWRNDKPTEKQLLYISELQEFSEFQLPKFIGITKGDACDYIDTYAGIAHRRLVSQHEDAGNRI